METSTIENKAVVGKSLNDAELQMPKDDVQAQQNGCCKVSVYDILEVVLLTPIILATIAFFLIPTILYALPNSSFEVSVNTELYA